MTLLVLLMIIIAYFTGSLSGALIISRIMHLPNPSEHGSHNPGATNMLRINGKLPAIMVLVFDMLKGAIPVYVAYRMGISPFFLGIVGIAACLGHIFPCFFDFHGGKGVATALGMMIPIGLDFTGCFILTWLLTVLVTGYSSVASIVAFLFTPLFVWLFKPELTLPVTMLSCVILIRHSSNVIRLFRGQEPKSLHFKSKSKNK
ncbi:glycerol-3-phosphate 1-O-acyltransferase PlsY [Gilliamella apicola]|uniref:Glycerol-3-phosphate acyltransferase n=1 Tax=Gilliamella apicola TaxID=1196095 RepID=A0A242NIS1_9GAMM|nr:glycerol-3-phosphate 1-O-acyltransferase PlsY [Gilliamella apicola]OTP82905.1 glycerol-3-phosphate acyltransferase [Gilliamella apicola]OTP86051.1 glycerol-3-phosphate acyltransferase [Gilliamella apicola]OTP89386.1 glycerol-3-phosphate acyltransferase [Gilliamella apicola]OTP99817.1 glycerol-3-phosphate acyltransferase [Gilliamella apicola]OTQ09791.1 glycerol-3-phosphate acyltransferase [Gilliamella apicola]